MDVLDSGDVNVVLNHYISCSLGFLTTTNGFLASLAVLTAVVSFWKLRSSSIPPPTTEKLSSAAAQVPPLMDCIATETTQLSLNLQGPTETYSCSSVVSFFGTIIEEEDQDQEEEEQDADMIKSNTTTSPRKFTVMYYGDVNNGEDETTLFQYSRDAIDYDEKSAAAASPLLRTRKGNNDLDWYRHQDLSMLNGNVVKLWDCKRQRKNSRVSLASSSISIGIRT